MFWLYALLVLVRVAGPAGRALGLASGAGPYPSETTGPVFLLLALHGVDVVVRSSVTATGEFGSLVTQVGTVDPVGGSVPVVADVLTDVVSTASTGVAFRVTFPDLLITHLAVCVVYPLVFGGVGALAGSVGAVGTNDRSLP